MTMHPIHLATVSFSPHALHDRMRLFRSANSSPGALTLTAQDPRFSPLDLPELLERILSFLDDRSSITAAGRVCSQWHRVIQRLLLATVVLNVNLTQTKRDAIVATIPGATRLIVGTSGSTFHTNLALEQDRLPSIFAAKAASSAAAPLRELVLSRGFSTMGILKSFLGPSSHLTGLTLHYTNHAQIELDLGTILTDYPHLVQLDLISTAQSGFGILEHKDGSTSLSKNQWISTLPIPSWLQLRSIRLEGLSITLATLRTFLTAVDPSTLQDLHLWKLHIPMATSSLTSPESLEVMEFPTFLTGLCLTLRSFSLSCGIFGSMRLLLDGMCQGHILESFGPRVHSWGFSVQFCYYLALMPNNNITTLDLSPEFEIYGDGWALMAHDLHRFLCQAAPNLRHLMARGVLFNTSHMDMAGLYPTTLSPMIQYPPPSTWICAGLQTLRLSFSTNTRPMQFGKRHSRIAFGYLARMCQELKEIEIGVMSSMRFLLEDGIVLLSRLPHLERLVFGPRYYLGRRTSMERTWDVVKPGPLVRIRQRMLIKSWQADLAKEVEDFKSHEDNKTKDGCDNQKAWMDTKYIGTLTDVKMALDDLYKDSYLERCWPSLQEIEIRYAWIDDQGVDRRTIHSRRPFRFTDECKPVLLPPIF